MKRIFQILIGLLIFLNVSFAQNSFIKRYSISDGLPTNKIFCACQDSKGFMWFGTDAGVIRFDGSNFVNFTLENGLDDNVTVRIKEDNIGRVWFFNLNGTTNFYFHNTIFNSINAPFLSELKTKFFLIDFFQDADSTLYFYNAISEVFVVKDDQLFDYRDFGFNNRNEAGLFFFNKTTDDKFLLWTSPGVFEIDNIDDSLKINPYYAKLEKVFQKNTNESIGVDRSGYVSFYRNTKIVKNKHIQLETQYVNSMVIDGDGLVWLASYDKGVYCYKNNEIVLHLDIERATTLVADNENNIWVTSEKEGVYKINRDILRFNYLEIDCFNNDGITKMFPAIGGGVWATNGESVFFILGKESFKIPLNIECNTIDNIYQLKNGNLIISGAGTEFYIVENVRFNKDLKLIQKGDVLIFNCRAKNITINKSESRLYTHFHDKLLWVNLERGLTVYVKTVKIGRINNLFFNNDNELIVNASKNYITNDLDSLYNYAVLKPFNGQIISSHLLLDEENEVFNFIGDKLQLLNNNKLYNLLRDWESEVDYRIKDMAYDGKTLFFFTIKTVYYINNPLKIIEGEPVELFKLNTEFNNINDIVCQDSFLHVASDEGLTSIPIKEFSNGSRQKAKPYFNNVLLNDKEVDVSSGRVDFKGQNKLSIEFASLNYSSMPIKYTYKLEGYDSNWIQGNETNVTYLNLPPGFYTFKLKSSMPGNKNIDTADFIINVKPTFFQLIITWIVLGLFFLLGLIFLVINIKNRQIEQKEKEHLLISLEHKALQSMMNPHFIFNALGSIQSYLLQNKATEAGTYLSQFARLIRQNMNSLKSNYISVEDEVERLRNYLELEKFRMDSKFDFTINYDEQLEIDEIGIPSMIVQPYVENAIWHGVSSLSVDGIINIQFKKNDEKSILVIIEDNGIGIAKTSEFPNSGQHLNMGSSLTEKRLKLIGERLKARSEVIIEELNPGLQNPGTKVMLFVPVLSDENRM